MTADKVKGCKSSKRSISTCDSPGPPCPPAGFQGRKILPEQNKRSGKFGERFVMFFSVCRNVLCRRNKKSRAFHHNPPVENCRAFRHAFAADPPSVKSVRVLLAETNAISSVFAGREKAGHCMGSEADLIENLPVALQWANLGEQSPSVCRCHVLPHPTLHPSPHLTFRSWAPRSPVEPFDIPRAPFVFSSFPFHPVAFSPSTFHLLFAGATISYKVFYFPPFTFHASTFPRSPVERSASVTSSYLLFVGATVSSNAL